MKLVALVVPVALALLLVFASGAPERTASKDGWRYFEGSWSASGERQSLQTGTGRASTVYLSGSIVLTSADGISKGFRGELIGFDDGAKISVGRCMWTDERGDRIFSTLTGDSIGVGRRFVGTIAGGTGRYAGLSGDFSSQWEYVVEAEGTVQGRAVGLRGRFQTSEAGR